MDASSFIELNLNNAIFLFLVGWVGGLVSGFIGSGGAFVLTPAMMSMGVPGIVAVASNMCHKFPKAMVGAIKRTKYGQVDWKLGLILGVSAEAGVLYGAGLQESIKQSFGNAGSNLYVSSIFVIVLGLVGSFVMRDALRSMRGLTQTEEKAGALDQWIYRIHIPGTMIKFVSIQQPISILITLPLGFATGLLAATIAVGGFVGVPSMIYVMGVPSLMASATELVIAFVMGLGGTFKFAWSGYVDLRLAMLILAGSLFGIQLGAIGTTYVKPYVIKLVMGTIMLIVMCSRFLVIPVYLGELEIMQPMHPTLATYLKNISLGVMILALLLGAGIVVGSIVKGMREVKATRRPGGVVATNFSVQENVVLSDSGCIMAIVTLDQAGEAVAQRAIQIAAGKKLVLATIVQVNTEGEFDPNPVYFYSRTLYKDMLMHATKQLQTMSQRLGIQDATIRVEIAQGITTALCMAKNEGAQLVVVGDHAPFSMNASPFWFYLMTGFHQDVRVLIVADPAIFGVRRWFRNWKNRKFQYIKPVVLTSST